MLDDLHVIGLRSSYVHANTSLYFLNNLIKDDLSACVQFVPRLMVCGFCFVLILIASYLSDELFVLVLVGLLNLKAK